MRPSRPRAALLYVGFAALLAACDSAEPPPAPERAQVFVCGAELARLVVALGAGPAVRGADSHSRELPGLGAVADLGEACSGAPALAGSLVADVALLDGSAPDLASKLEARGLPSRVLAPGDLNAVLAVYRELGALLGAETRALAVQARLLREISAVAARRHGRSRLRVVWLLEGPAAGAAPAAGGEGWVVVGGVGVLHELLELAGAENAFHEPGSARHRVGAAAVVAAAPELVLDATGRVGRSRLPEIAARTVTVPEALARAPVLDPLERVRALYALLYPAAE